GETGRLEPGPGGLAHLGARVHRDHAATLADGPGQLRGEEARATADVEAALTRAHAEGGERPRALLGDGGAGVGLEEPRHLARTERGGHGARGSLPPATASGLPACRRVARVCGLASLARPSHQEADLDRFHEAGERSALPTLGEDARATRGWL